MKLWKKDFLALDMGSYSAKLVEGSYGKKLDIYHYDSFPELSFDADNQQMTDRESYARILKNILETHPFRVRNCILSFSNSSTITKEFLLPRMKVEDLRYNVSIELAEYLPLGIDQYVYDFKVIEEITQENFMGYRILVFAILRKTINQCIETAEAAGLKINAIDVSLNARNNLLAFIGTPILEQDKPYGMIDIGHTLTNISIFMNGHYLIHKGLHFGVKDISEKGIVTPEMNIWSSEISRVFDYFHAQNPGKKVEKIFLLGGGSLLQNIGEYIKSRTGLTILPLSLLAQSPKLNILLKREDDFPIIFNALGLFIRGGVRV